MKNKEIKMRITKILKIIEIHLIIMKLIEIL